MNELSIFHDGSRKPSSSAEHDSLLNSLTKKLPVTKFNMIRVTGVTAGNCKSGSDCKFAHGEKELVKLEPPKIEEGLGWSTRGKAGREAGTLFHGRIWDVFRLMV